MNMENLPDKGLTPIEGSLGQNPFDFDPEVLGGGQEFQRGLQNLLHPSELEADTPETTESQEKPV